MAGLCGDSVGGWRLLPGTRIRLGATRQPPGAHWSSAGLLASQCWRFDSFSCQCDFDGEAAAAGIDGVRPAFEALWTMFFARDTFARMWLHDYPLIPLAWYPLLVGGLGGMMRFTPFGGKKDRINKACKTCFEEGVVLFYAGHGPYHLRMLPPLGVMREEDWPKVFECVERGLARAAAE